MASATSTEEPAFITYLLDPQHDYDCYFYVGDETINIPIEKIGVVKKMLLAHSEVLRTQLLESKMAEKGDVYVTDVFPQTFKSLIKYVYGYDTTPTLCFGDADNLLYTAEKYMITDLKHKAAKRLMALLSPDNICSLLNNPACFQVLHLKSEITKILKSETDKVLASPQFLDLSCDAFLKILQQEQLMLPEIEIWRAAIKWAKNKTGSGEGLALRTELARPLHHIRVCTLTLEEFCKEIIPADVLTYSEVKLVSKSLGSEESQTELTDICNKTKKRFLYIKSGLLIESYTSLTLYGYIRTSSISITPKALGLELTSLEFPKNNQGYNKLDCTVTIFKDVSREALHTKTVSNVQCAQTFSIPLTGVELLPNTEYIVTTAFSVGHDTYYSKTDQAISCSNFSVKLDKNGQWYIMHPTKIMYRTIRCR